VYGPEHLLTRRARSREIGEKLIERIRWWSAMRDVWRHARQQPFAGNKEGGLTTFMKNRSAPPPRPAPTAMNGVLLYGELITRGF